MAFNNSDWADLYQNLRKAWCWWGMVEKVSMRTGVAVRARAMLYKALVQMILLYGIKRWVVTGEMLKVLDGFHHRVARQMLGKKDHRTVDG